jgi:hypothetical protein
MRACSMIASSAAVEQLPLADAFQRAHLCTDGGVRERHAIGCGGHGSVFLDRQKRPEHTNFTHAKTS